jgi:hypothetical protein
VANCPPRVPPTTVPPQPAESPAQGEQRFSNAANVLRVCIPSEPMKMLWLISRQQQTINGATASHSSGLHISIVRCSEQVSVRQIQKLWVVVIAVPTRFKHENRMISVIRKMRNNSAASSSRTHHNDRQFG